MNLEECREQIDLVDRQLIDLIRQRMEVSAQVAAYKKAHHLPLFHPERERQVLEKVSSPFPAEQQKGIRLLFEDMMEVSKSYQSKMLPVNQRIFPLFSTPVRLPALPSGANTACQGVEGAYSQIACQTLLERPEIIFYRSFEDVFAAVESGRVEFGVLPIENSTAGSVSAVYDLMSKYQFTICRSLQLRISHCLLGLPDARVDQIKKVLSHEQALSQCGEYLWKNGIEGETRPNTAMAAREVRRIGDQSVAAIGSAACAELYGLKVLINGIQSQSQNYTRFICISKSHLRLPSPSRASLRAILPHQVGSLYQVLRCFAMEGINLLKLESRPIPSAPSQFQFYFDLDAACGEKTLVRVLEGLCARCRVELLGIYPETEA